MYWCRQLKSWGLVAGVATALLLSQAAMAANWPTFRGADRSGVSKETNLLQEWPEGGPKLLWKSEGAGRGYTSLAIADGRIYLLGDGVADVQDKDEYLICLSADDGHRLWATRIGPPWNEGQPTWQSSRSTPTVDGDRVYSLSAGGDLMCCDAMTGEEKWRKNLKNDFEGKKADIWGYSESVLIDGDNLICTPGGDKNTMVALNKLTGSTVWATALAEDRGAGHASIVISDIAGIRVYVQSTGSGGMGVRASDGKLMWSYKIDKTTAVIPTPIVKDDLVFIVAGYKRGGALLKQKPDGDGGITIDEIYPIKPPLANKHGGLVLVGNHLYGDSDDQGIPFCADLTTGEVVWRKRGTGTQSIAMAATSDRLYLHFADGRMVLAKADPADYVEVGSFVVPGSGQRPSWSQPVILDGKLYLRENSTILCYDIKQDGETAKAGGN